MDLLQKRIAKGQRKVCATSLKVYKNQLNKMCKEIHGREYQGASDFYDSNTIIDHLTKNKSAATTRARLSAILVALAPEDYRKKPTLIKALEAHTSYSDKLREMLLQRREQMETQTMSPRIRNNWTTMECLREVQQMWEKKATRAMKSKMATDYADKFQTIQNWVIASLFVLDNYPRRNEYADMRIITFQEFHKNTPDSEKQKYNWLVYCESAAFRDRMSFHFYQYKTRRKFGAQIIPIRPKLTAVLQKWLTVNKSGWLLLNKSMKKLSRNYLAIRLPQVFRSCGKQIGSCMIRHIFISEQFEHDSSFRQRKFLSEAMGHTVTCQQLSYRKVDIAE